MKNILVHIHEPGLELWDFPDSLATRWRSKFGADRFNLTVARSRAQFESALSDAEVLIGGGLTRARFPSAPRLEWLQTSAVGVGSQLFPQLIESPIVVTNTRGIYAEPMAEHLLAMILSFSRGLPRARDDQLSQRWQQRRFWSERPYPDEISGKTLGIVGLGSIGRALARRALALGMRVIAVRRRQNGEPHESIDVRPTEELDWLLEAADFVVNALPLTVRTRGIFDRTRLRRMKPSAYFFNVGRGGTVQEDALVEALTSGQIAGAGLDVTAQEPLPEESPLYRLSNVILTPHISGTSPRFWERAGELFEKNIERFLGGRPLINVVDKTEGY